MTVSSVSVELSSKKDIDEKGKHLATVLSTRSAVSERPPGIQVCARGKTAWVQKRVTRSHRTVVERLRVKIRSNFCRTTSAFASSSASHRTQRF